MSDMGHNAVNGGMLRQLVERIERLDESIAALNGDKSEVYKEAKAHGYDAKILRKVVSARRKDASEREEEDAIFDLYMSALGGLVRAHVENIEEFDPETGEIHDTDNGQFIGRTDDEQRDAARVSSADGRGKGDDEGAQGQGPGDAGIDRRSGPVSGTVDRQDEDRGSRHVGGEVDHEITSSAGGAIGEVKAQGRLPNATGVEPSPADPDEEFVPPAFLSRESKPLRPLCQNPDNCSSYGAKTCHTCLTAAGVSYGASA